MPDLFQYQVFGLRVASELPLPELKIVQSSSKADVTIRQGSINGLEGPAGLSLHEQGALLDISEAGRFLISNGSEMIVEPRPDAADRNVRLFLLGSAFAAILHQRGLLPLHANAVVVEGRTIAFMGHPGAGKSTLAAWFNDNDYTVLADDVCVVTCPPNHAPIAHAGIPRLRLWREALEASGRTTSGYERSFDDMDKYTVPTDKDDAPASAPLSHIYLLDKADAGEGSEIVRLQGAEAVEALVANTYRGAYIPLMAGTQKHLIACATLAAKVPVFRAKRVWGYADFETENSALAGHARKVMAERG